MRARVFESSCVRSINLNNEAAYTPFGVLRQKEVVFYLHRDVRTEVHAFLMSRLHVISPMHYTQERLSSIDLSNLRFTAMICLVCTFPPPKLLHNRRPLIKSINSSLRSKSVVRGLYLRYESITMVF